MPRNLDLTALRAFMVTADTGGVTRAASLLNLTQSAVSMQIKRLEEALARPFFFRNARRLTLTPEGEQLLAYARRMLSLNDEVLARLTDTALEGELRLGVPHDIVFPAIPDILKRMAQCYPRLRINLTSSFTLTMKEALARGEQADEAAVLADILKRDERDRNRTVAPLRPAPDAHTLDNTDLDIEAGVRAAIAIVEAVRAGRTSAR